MSSSKQEIRIVLVGDPQVGKTSLITVLVSNTFNANSLPGTIPCVTFSPDATPEKVMIHIVDTPSRSAEHRIVEDEIRKADALCVVYDVSRAETFHRLGTYWLEEIARLREGMPSIPIIIVGNKIDLRDSNISDSTGESILKRNLEVLIKPIMEKYEDVETCVECSAKEIKNIQEVFYFAQKAVLYPTTPLFNSATSQLKNECVRALHRIFRLCDKDKDNALNDEELNEWKRKCFNEDIKNEELQGIKSHVQDGAPDGINERGLTIVGFLYLHHLFIQKGDMHTTWAVLRRFGYGDDLELRHDYLYPNLDLKEDQCVELSRDGYQVLKDLFTQHDMDRDGALNADELKQLFVNSPEGSWDRTQFTETVETDSKGNITLQGFLSRWNMATLLDYKITSSNLAYFGVDPVPDAFYVTNSRESDLQEKSVSRHVFRAFVFGSAGSGKSSFLKEFIKKKFVENGPTPSGEFNVANAVVLENGKEAYLVMTEFPNVLKEREVACSEDAMSVCDVVCLLYDTSDPKSFAHAASIHTELNAQSWAGPILYFATKSDIPASKQIYKSSPQDFAMSMKVPPPLSISVKKGVEREVYANIVQSIYTYYNTTSSRWPLLLGIGVAVTLIVGGVAYYKYKK